MLVQGATRAVHLTAVHAAPHAGGMSFLLPQTRTGVVQGVRTVDIHGDCYLDVVLVLEGDTTEPARGRVSVLECPQDLAAGERVAVRFTMGVMTNVTRVPG